MFNRTRYRLPSPDNSRAGAKVYELLVRQKLARGEPLREIPKPKDVKTTFAAFADRWFKDYVVVNNKLSEQRSKTSILKVHLFPFFGKMDLREISRYEIDRYKADKQKKGVNHKTINNSLHVLSKCLKTAEEWEVLDATPKIKHLKVAPPKFDYLSQEECDLLLLNASGIIKDMILFAWHTGLRFGEIIALTWNDIDLERGTISVNKAIARGYLGTTKSNKTRQAYVTADVREMLDRRRKETANAIVFPNTKGRYMIQQRCVEWLHDICDKSGLRRIGWHTFRHTFASHLVEKGVSLRTVQDLLGHSDPQTTMRYAHLGPVILQEAIRIFDKPRIVQKLRHNSVTIANSAREDRIINKASFSNFPLKTKQKQDYKSCLLLKNS